MKITSVTQPGTTPPTSLDTRYTTEDSLVDVWCWALRHGEDPAVIVEDMWRHSS